MAEQKIWLISGLTEKQGRIAAGYYSFWLVFRLTAVDCGELTFAKITQQVVKCKRSAEFRVYYLDI